MMQGCAKKGSRKGLYGNDHEEIKLNHVDGDAVQQIVYAEVR